MISVWPTSFIGIFHICRTTAFLWTLSFHVLCLSWCIFFSATEQCSLTLSLTLRPSNLQGQQGSPPQWRPPGYSLVLKPEFSFSHSYNLSGYYYCVILSLNLPTDLESGLLEGVNYHTAYAQLVSITPGLCEMKVISALTNVCSNQSVCISFYLIVHQALGSDRTCHCSRFPDEESRLCESVSLVAKPQRQKG